MRITHTSALHGFAVFSAGTALFASAMLAGAGAANAATVTAPDQAAVGATQSQPGLSHQYGEEHCWKHHKHGKKDGKKEHGKAYSESDDSIWPHKDGKKDHSKADSEKSDKSNWGKEDGKKDHSKADSESDGMSGWGEKKDHSKADSESDGSSWGKKDGEHGKKDDEHGKKDDKSSWGEKKDHSTDGMEPQSKSEDGHHGCEMPRGSVESGRGGAALASSQSSTTTISLGALAALMLGSGVWTLYRSRRTRVRSAVK